MSRVERLISGKLMLMAECSIWFSAEYTPMQVPEEISTHDYSVAVHTAGFHSCSDTIHTSIPSPSPPPPPQHTVCMIGQEEIWQCRVKAAEMETAKDLRMISKRNLVGAPRMSLDSMRLTSFPARGISPTCFRS